MIKFIKRKRKKRSILWNWGNHVVSTWHQANRMVLYYRTNGFSLKTIFPPLAYHFSLVLQADKSKRNYDHSTYEYDNVYWVSWPVLSCVSAEWKRRLYCYYNAFCCGYFSSCVAEFFILFFYFILGFCKRTECCIRLNAVIIIVCVAFSLIFLCCSLILCPYIYYIDDTD